MAASSTTFRPGKNPARKPKMPSEREAMRMLKDLGPKAMKRLKQLIDSDDEKVAGAAVKLVTDKIIHKELVENPFQFPESVLRLPKRAQLLWTEERLLELQQIRDELAAIVGNRALPVGTSLDVEDGLVVDESTGMVVDMLTG